MSGTEDTRSSSPVKSDRAAAADAGLAQASAGGSGDQRLPERWSGDTVEREDIAALVRAAPADTSSDAGRALSILDNEALRRLSGAAPVHTAVREIARELTSVTPGLRARVLSFYLAGYVAHHLCASCRSAVGLPPTGQPEVAPIDCARCAAFSIAEALGSQQRAALDLERAALAQRMRLEHERSRTLIEHATRLHVEGHTIREQTQAIHRAVRPERDTSV